MTTNIIYNNIFLQDFCKEHNIILLKDYSNENINRDSIIEGKCKSENCFNSFTKTFRSMYSYSSFYCLIHKKENTLNKIKKTCLEKYGVEYYLKTDDKQIKSKKTCLEKYGVEYNSQSQEVKNQIKETCLEKYGVENPSQSKQFKDKSKNTCLEKYGVEHYSKTNEYLDKCKNTCLEKYGVNNYSKTDDYLNKVKNTNLERYGVEYYLQTEDKQIKSKKTCLEKYGVEYPFQLEETRNKFKNTNLEKYGVEYPSKLKEIQTKYKTTNLKRYCVENPSQNSDIMEKCSKNAYKLKEYILPSGNIIKIQGYEHYALDELLKDGILEEDIINGCKNVPEIWYTDENNKSHRHYVDIFIPSQNRCIEVKSTWTAEKKKDCIFLKQQAGKELGYSYEIWVYNGKGEKVECYKL